jgi:hypothetical protein
MRFLLIILILVCRVSISQNLVPNPSFETYTICPNNTGQINYALDWIEAISSPDYFNSCSTNTNVSIPKNFFGGNYQQAKSGNAYAGIITLGTFGNNMRENMGIQLISTLLNNNYYIVKFYIVNMQCYKLANNNLALNFSSALTTTVSAGNTVNLPMHIYKFGNPVIKDTLNWTEIMGVYKANGTEQYITIGNFKDDANTKIDTTNYGSFGNAAYYLIDDVSVEPICTPFWSYRDTTLAIGQDSVLIGPAITGLNINWYDASNTFITNAPGIYVKPAQTTTYTAVEDFCGNTYTNTIVVTVQPTGLNEFGMTNAELRIFPNPTTGKLKFVNNNLIDTEQLQIKICNVLGREIKQMEYKEEIDISVLEKGIYFLSLYKNNQLLLTKKVIKQ